MTSPLDPDFAGPLPYNFSEWKDSPTESFNWETGNGEFTRMFKGPWADRFDFIRDHILSTVEGDGEGNTYSLAQAYPEATAAKAYSCNIKGWGKTDLNDSTGLIQHDLAIITVKYKIPEGGGVTDTNQDGRDPEDDIVFPEVQMNTSSQIFTFPRHEVKDEDGDVLQNNLRHGQLGKVYNIIHFTFKERLMVSVDWQAIGKNMGKVNLTDIFLPPYYMVHAECCRYDGPSAISKVEIGRFQLAWDVTHKFEIVVAEGANLEENRRLTWNRIFVVKDNNMLILGITPAPFQTATMHDISRFVGFLNLTQNEIDQLSYLTPIV